MADYPALPLWTDAYLADTRHLTTTEHGAYLLLLMEAWRRPSCSLPDDDVLLARLTGMSEAEWAASKKVIMAFWKRDGRKKEWTQKRLVSTRAFLVDKSVNNRNAAITRWKDNKKSHANALRPQCQNDASKSKSNIPLLSPKKDGDQTSERTFSGSRLEPIADVLARYGRLKKK